MSISADCYIETADEKNEENKEILLDILHQAYAIFTCLFMGMQPYLDTTLRLFTT